jgi:hypothetical protein
MGSIPWVLMQLVLVVIVIFFPATVTSFLDKPVVVDESKATELLQQVDMGTKSNSNDEAIKAMEGVGAGAAGDAKAKEDDPMAAFKDLPKDGEKK